ncbi:MAG TPA: PAS domain-containing sensor histidine kinase [Gemmatimonadaceae bacterium]
MLSAISAAVAQRAPHYLRHRIVRPDGEVRWLEAHGALMFDGAGRPIRLVGVCGDITEREAERAAVESARRAAEAANAAKSEFLATMSHELRTPLNAISGYVDLLTMELRGPVTEAQREDLTRIKKSGQHLLSLINDILNLARIESGRLELDVTDVPLVEVLETVEALMIPQMHARKLSYRNVHAAPTITARADAEKLQQILLNLLTNACKFTAPGGCVAIDCDQTPNWPMHDGDGRGEGGGAGTVVVRVRDTGRGIPAEKLASVFEPFVQIDRQATHASQQGVGLGLAISRDLARAMGGELTAQSIVGEGSTFTLTLPSGAQRRVSQSDERPRGGRAAARDGH